MEKVNISIEKSWGKVLESEFKKDYFIELNNFVQQERKEHKVFPPEPLIFNAFNLTPFNKVKVVILGQDPYHGEKQAHGLCFSVPHGIKIPPSLINIFKEQVADVGIEKPDHGNLTEWAQQGILLINATLTVRANEAGSHQKKGWETFTDAVIQLLSDKQEGLIFLLWGNYAQAKEKLIDATKHHVLKSAHPSPLSAHNGFFGCQHFSATNQLLQSMGKTPINWQIQPLPNLFS